MWQYTNPFPDSGDNSVFKVEYIPPTPPEKPNLDAIGRLVWTDVKPGAVVNGSFQVVNFGDPKSLLNWKVDKISLGWGNWTIVPESGVNLTPEEGPVTVHVQGFIPDKTNKAFQGSLLVLNQDNTSDNDTIPVIIQTFLSTPFSPVHPFFDLLRYWLSCVKDYALRHECGLLPCFHTGVAGGTIG